MALHKDPIWAPLYPKPKILKLQQLQPPNQFNSNFVSPVNIDCANKNLLKVNISMLLNYTLTVLFDLHAAYFFVVLNFLEVLLGIYDYVCLGVEVVRS
jgi:hypothetical protein